jgi:hypothetical protein
MSSSSYYGTASLQEVAEFIGWYLEKNVIETYSELDKLVEEEFGYNDCDRFITDGLNRPRHKQRIYDVYKPLRKVYGRRINRFNGGYILNP